MKINKLENKYFFVLYGLIMPALLIFSLFSKADSSEVSVINANFEEITLSGVSSRNTPKKIHKSQNGKLWLFYETFLVIKSGSKSETHQYNDFLANDHKRYDDIFAASNNKELVFSLRDQIIRYQYSTKNFKRFDIPEHLNEIIIGIEKDSENNIWVASFANLFKLTSNGKAIEPVKIPKELLDVDYPSIIFVAFKIDDSGNKWLASAVNGFMQLTQENKFEIIDKSFDMQNIVREIVAIKNNKILLATAKGLFIYKPENKLLLPFYPDTITSEVSNVVVQENGNIWFASENKLWKIDEDLTKLAIVSLNTSNAVLSSDFEINQMISDNENTLFISVDKQGLYKYNLQKNILTPSNLIKELNNPLYFKTLGNVDYVISDSAQTYIKSYDKLYHFPTAFAYIDKKSNYWLGSKQSVYKLNNFGEYHKYSLANIEKYSYPIVSIAIDYYENLWLVSERKGLFVIGLSDLEKQKEQVDLGISAEIAVNVRAVFEGGVLKKDMLLIATNAIYSYDLESKQLRNTFLLPEGLADIENVDNEGNNIIFYHSNNQISILNKNANTLRQYTLPFSAKGCAIEDENKVWWFSQKFGQLINLSENQEIYDQSNGIPKNGLDGVVCYKKDATLHFSSGDRLLFFQPQNYQLNDVVPKTYIDSVEIYDDTKKITLHDVNTIHIKQNSFPIKFNLHSDSYSSEEKNKYQYRIVSNSKAWRDISFDLQQVSFDALPPDYYQLQFRSSNNNDIWSEPVAFGFKVEPQLWLTLWAKIIYAFVVILVIYLFYSQRLKRSLAREKELENVVLHRTNALNKEKLTVENLLSRKNEEFANISHEFRTPLTLILGPLAQVLKTNTSTDETNRLNIVQRNGYRLLRMVDQLLNMETFRVKAITQKSPQAFGKIIRLLATAFTDLANEKKIELEIKNVADVSFEFTSDALEKIVLNLLSNAIKYTKSGGSISIESIRTENNELEIQVVDTGIGIPAGKIDSVFERYSRVLDENSEQVTGAGIGLALVKALVEAHQGRIKIKSELGKGTSITVILPIVGEVNDNQVRPYSNDEIITMELMSLTNQNATVINNEINAITNNTLDKPTVLVIEDNLDMRNYIVSSINDDYQVITANNGEEGVEAAINEVPDLIISDVMMPKMDGYQATHALRTNDVTNHIPIILLTARGDRESRLKGWHQKADEYLTKPFDIEELKVRLNNLLEIRNILKKRFAESVFIEKKNRPIESEIGDTIQTVSPNLVVENFINKLNVCLEKMYAESTTSITDIASAMAMSERQFSRKLKSVLDLTPAEYLRRIRLEKSKIILEQGHSVNYAAFEVGFSSQSYFGKCYKAQFGVSPTDYKKQLDNK